MEAAARGWIDAPAIFEVAAHAERLGDGARVEDVFAAVLGPEKLAALLAEDDATWAKTRPGKAPAFARDVSTQVVAADPIGHRLPEPPLDAPRYELGEEIGRGGVGRVVLAIDREIGRTVAVKTLREDTAQDETLRRRFLAEARITAGLEHPGIVPIHDLGVLPDGRLFYVMRVVGTRSLREVLRGSRAAWPLSRLSAIFVQVCRAMAYAHSKGVLHRDLKPGNVLLGDYGEVYVADWGIAKRLGEPETGGGGAASTSGDTGADSLLGTPGYMPPEQARAEWPSVDHRADLFPLGCILYEILTGRSPFSRAKSQDAIAATILEEPPRPRDVAPGCPLVLEDLCLRLLAKEPEGRPGSAEEVAAEVEAFLEGAKERERRREEATRLAEQAAEPVRRYAALGEEARSLLAEARRLLLGVRTWDPVEKKRAAWEREARAKAIDSERAMALAEAVELYSQALSWDPEHHAARAGLADLYWSRAREAADERKDPTRLYYESLVREYDDGGRYSAMLSSDARMSVRTQPEGAVVRALRYVERDRMLVATGEQVLGRTPIEDARLEPGSWLLLFDRPGFPTVRYPFVARRGKAAAIEITLRTQGEIGAGWAYVPAGVSIVGGDPEAIDPLPRAEVLVGDFAIRVLPTTFAEYLEFIEDLEGRDPEAARKRLPQDRFGQGVYAVKGADGRWAPDWERLIEGEGRTHCRAERAGEIPLLGIDWFDANAYCRWRSEKEGAVVRLPTEAEWERAARGADGRSFPWGDGFDATFCKMGESRPGLPQPEPVGAFPGDCSPFGVRDMAGGCAEWVADVEGEVSGLDEASAPSSGSTSREDAWGFVRGGAWQSRDQNCRTTSRRRAYTKLRLSVVGLRVAKSLG